MGGKAGGQLDVTKGEGTGGQRTHLHVVDVTALDCLSGGLESSMFCVEKMVLDTEQPGLGFDDEGFRHLVETQPVRICKTMPGYDQTVWLVRLAKLEDRGWSPSIRGLVDDWLMIGV